MCSVTQFDGACERRARDDSDWWVCRTEDEVAGFRTSCWCRVAVVRPTGSLLLLLGRSCSCDIISDMAL